MMITISGLDVVLVGGLQLLVNVDKPGEWLMTDDRGWEIYGLLTQLTTGELMFSPRWQVGFCWTGKTLTIYRQPGLTLSPFVADGHQGRLLKKGKKLTH